MRNQIEDLRQQAIEQGKEQVKKMAKEAAKEALKEASQEILAELAPILPYIIAALIIIVVVVGLVDWQELETGAATTGESVATGWWWPIGSTETTTEGGKLFASGTPPHVAITAQFAEDRDTYTHKGTDMDYDVEVNQEEQYIVAVRSGTVEVAGYDSGAGNWVIIDHGDGFKSVYMHMENDSLKVNVGDSVDYGQVLGLMGNTGNSEGEHLHIEIHENGVPVNPLDYISQEDPRPVTVVEYTSVGTSAALIFVMEGENSSLRGYIDGRYSYDYSPYIYNYITRDKQYYLMGNDLGLNCNGNYGFGVCFFVENNYCRSNPRKGQLINSVHRGYFQNTSYFIERGYDVKNNTAYQKYYESKIPVSVVDDIKSEIYEERRQEVKSTARSLGVTLTQYQIDVLADMMYQGYYISDVIRSYKSSGLSSATRAASSGFSTSKNGYRGERRWILFSTGKYLDASGKEIKVSSTGAVSDVSGNGYTKSVTVGKRKYLVYNQGAFPGNIGPAGCSITSEAIVLSAYGKNKTPKNIADDIGWAFPRSISQIASDLTKYGVKSTASVKYNQHNNSSTHRTAISEIKNNLSSGKPVIILVRSGPDARYTGSAHYMVLVGYNEKGYPIIADPNGGRCRTESTLEDLVKKYIYAYSEGGYEQGYVLINQ